MKLVSKESVSSGLSVECNFCSDESHTLSPTFYQIDLEFEYSIWKVLYTS